MDRQDHWNRVYRDKAVESVSWYQSFPETSLDMIAASGVGKAAGIIDVGGGASVLVAHLLALGYSSLAVLDVSGAALQASRARLGARADEVDWIEADVTRFQPPRRYALWHDRAAFHFLTDPADRAAYVRTLRRTLQQDGTVVMATFAPDGPPKCSGLDVLRHDERSIGAELGAEFRMREWRRETHVTPAGAAQRFIYCRFERDFAMSADRD